MGEGELKGIQTLTPEEMLIPGETLIPFFPFSPFSFFFASGYKSLFSLVSLFSLPSHCQWSQIPFSSISFNFHCKHWRNIPFLPLSFPFLHPFNFASAYNRKGRIPLAFSLPFPSLGIPEEDPLVFSLPFPSQVTGISLHPSPLYFLYAGEIRISSFAS